MTKTLLTLAVAAITFSSCGDTHDDENTQDGVDTTAVMAEPTTTTETNTTTSTTYAPADGDVTYENRKVRVYRGGTWVDADNDVELDNGVVVYRDGRVVRNDEEVVLVEGDRVNRRGDFFDRAGNTAERGWEKTKDGAKKAGRAVGNAAEKVGEKVENAVD